MLFVCYLQSVDVANTHFTVDEMTGEIAVKVMPLKKRKYILYVGGTDGAANPGQRRSAMAIVQIVLEGSMNDQLVHKVQVVKPAKRRPLLQETQPSTNQEVQRVRYISILSPNYRYFLMIKTW